MIVVGFALRWQYVHLPMAEAHSWRQITNADIARNFTEVSANILYPQVSWGGPKDGTSSMEFPLLQWLAGMLFHVVRDREFVCRILSILFSWVRWSRPTFWARGCSARRRDVQQRFFWPSPHRSCSSAGAFISDTPMVFFSVGALGSRRLRSDSQSSCGMVGHRQHDAGVHGQVPAVLIFAPIAWLAWNNARKHQRPPPGAAGSARTFAPCSTRSGSPP